DHGAFRGSGRDGLGRVQGGLVQDPDGVALPVRTGAGLKFDEVAERARRAREDGREVVLVLGLGFVGTAVVANLARTAAGGRRVFFVIGLDQDSAAGREKAASLDAGRPPTYADDPSLARVIAEAAIEPRSVVGTVDLSCIPLADVVVSCINLDLVRVPGQTEELAC